jgi:hypothetical protein
MLDTGYPGMHRGEIQKNPDFGELSRAVSRNQYPESRNIANDFHQDTIIARKHLMQLKG